MSYELDVNDILTFADTINGHKKEKGDELWFEHCPYCGNDSKDTYTFSVNKKTGAFNCLNFSVIILDFIVPFFTWLLVTLK